AAISAKVAAAVIEIAVVGKLVGVLLLAGRVVRVIVGHVFVSGVLAGVVVNDALATGRVTAPTAPPDIINAQVVGHLVVATTAAHPRRRLRGRRPLRRGLGPAGGEAQ